MLCFADTGTTLLVPFEDRSNVVRWNIDLRYRDCDVPSNIDEIPQDYTPDWGPVTATCHPGEAYFRDSKYQNPEREMTEPAGFAVWRQRWDQLDFIKSLLTWTRGTLMINNTLTFRGKSI